MATDQSGKETKASKGTTTNQSAATTQADTQAETQARIVWDDSNMRSAYANVCNVAGGREEIVFLFGMNQAWDASQKELKVQLSDRIVLSPFAAKRFAILLNNVLRNYEAQYGKLEAESRPAGQSRLQ